MNLDKVEKIVGYMLLAIGLILIILPAILALMAFLSAVQIPQLVPNLATETDGFVRALAVFSNACLIFFVLAVTVWAGSIISSRGVSMIKDAKLKIVGKDIQELAQTAKQE